MTLAQLPLAVQLDDFAVLETFVAGPNAAAVAHVEAVARGERRDVLWLWSGRGQGKSHLLQAACRAAGAAGRRAMYLPFDADAGIEPGALAGSEHVDLMALDEPERRAGRAEWERGLFSVLDAFQHRGGLIVASRCTPATSAFALPDLASRAAGAIVYRLEPLDEDGCREALVRHARARGLVLEESAASYLLARVERDMRGICAWLDRLDRASLAAQRRVTIPLIRAALRASRDGSGP